MFEISFREDHILYPTKGHMVQYGFGVVTPAVRWDAFDTGMNHEEYTQHIRVKR